MIAKVIAHGATRREAASRLARALETTRIQGLTTNRDFLVACVAHARISRRGHHHRLHRPGGSRRAAGRLSRGELHRRCRGRGAGKPGTAPRQCRKVNRSIPRRLAEFHHAHGAHRLQGRRRRPAHRVPGAPGPPVPGRRRRPRTAGNRATPVGQRQGRHGESTVAAWHLPSTGTAIPGWCTAKAPAVSNCRNSRRYPVPPGSNTPSGGLLAPMPGAVLAIGGRARAIR